VISLRLMRGRPTFAQEKQVQLQVLELLPKDGSRVRAVKLKQKADALGISTKTLYRYLNDLTPEFVRRTVDATSTPPKVYYRRVTDLERRIGRLVSAREPKWTREAKKVYDSMCVVLSLFTHRLASVICDACEKKNAKEAQQYVDRMLDMELRPHLQEIVRFFYRNRDLETGEVKVADYVSDSFLMEEDVEQWIKKYTPNWAKAHVGHLPSSILTQVLIQCNKDDALKEIEDFYKAAEAAKKAHA